jgi:hypothetical protein
MKTINKVLLRFFSAVIIGIFLISFSYASSDNQRIDIKFNGQTMSADLEHVALRLILEKIKSEKGMWFKGNESVLEERVSVQFKDFPVQEGLKRILFDINHVLFFDYDKKLVGVFIVGKEDAGRAVSRHAATSAGKGLLSQPGKEAKDSKNPFEIFSGEFSPDHPWAKIMEKAKTRMSGKPSFMGSSPLDNPFAKKMAPDSESRQDEEILQGSPFMLKESLSSENPSAPTFTITPVDPFAIEAPSQHGNPFLLKP